MDKRWILIKKNFSAKNWWQLNNGSDLWFKVILSKATVIVKETKKAIQAFYDTMKRTFIFSGFLLQKIVVMFLTILYQQVLLKVKMELFGLGHLNQS